MIAKKISKIFEEGKAFPSLQLVRTSRDLSVQASATPSAGVPPPQRPRIFQNR